MTGARPKWAGVAIAGAALLMGVLGAGAQTQVDAAIVLAADASVSMSDERLSTQYVGHAAAFRHPAVIAAITGGEHGAIAVTFVEWAEERHQVQMIDWTLIASADDAHRFAATILKASADGLSYDDALVPKFGIQLTSISGAIDFSTSLLLETLPYDATRLVIDISGDGVQNEPDDPAVLEAARAAALARGVTINGLPIPTNGRFAPDEDIVEYFERSVIGGPNAFSIAVESWEKFPDALRRKLVLEIAGLTPESCQPPATDDADGRCPKPFADAPAGTLAVVQPAGLEPATYGSTIRRSTS